MKDWEKLIRNTASKLEDAYTIGMSREQREEQSDDFQWHHQNDVSPEEHKYDLTIKVKPLWERKPF